MKPTALAVAAGAKSQPPSSAGGRPRRTADVALANFDKLPRSSVVPGATACVVLSVGASTLRRLGRADKRLAPIQLGPRTTRYSVAGIRDYLRGEGSAK